MTKWLAKIQRLELTKTVGSEPNIAHTPPVSSSTRKKQRDVAGPSGGTDKNSRTASRTTWWVQHRRFASISRRENTEQPQSVLGCTGIINIFSVEKSMDRSHPRIPRAIPHAFLYSDISNGSVETDGRVTARPPTECIHVISRLSRMQS